MILRGLAVFLGLFTLLNLAGSLFGSHFDLNNWWIDFRPLPPMADCALLLPASICLLMFGFNPSWFRSIRWFGVILFSLVALVALVNVNTFYRLLGEGRVHSLTRLPLSIGIFAFFSILAWQGMGERSRANWTSIGRVAAVACLTALAFPLVQMLLLGTTDYRRRADAVVVLGARAYADGTASQALADRVRTACQLYHQHCADKLIFSGGPGDGAISEPQSMRRLAMQLGVPSQAILLDERGMNTDTTVTNTIAIFDSAQIRNVLVVSHAYHLPRVRMAYQRAGWNVLTVPAKETRYLRREPILICREVAAFWFYYLRPAVG